MTSYHYHHCWLAPREWVAPNVASSLQSERFWAVSSASVSVRLWDFRSYCTVLNRVIWGLSDGLCQHFRSNTYRNSTGGLFQPSGRNTNRCSTGKVHKKYRSAIFSKYRAVTERTMIRYIIIIIIIGVVILVLSTVQLVSYIIAMPEANVALVQMPRVPNKRGHMTVNVKQPDQHYSYVDLNKFAWDCKAGMWKRRSPRDRSVAVYCWLH